MVLGMGMGLSKGKGKGTVRSRGYAPLTTTAKSLVGRARPAREVKLAHEEGEEEQHADALKPVTCGQVPATVPRVGLADADRRVQP
eukprot:scaffold62207_cov54-Phaeocystis_antarctica.AAC.1